MRPTVAGAAADGWATPSRLRIDAARGQRAPVAVATHRDGGPPRLIVDDIPNTSAPTLDDRVLGALAAHPLTRTALRDALGVRNETLGVALQRLLDAKRLVYTADGLAAVPVPA